MKLPFKRSKPKKAQAADVLAGVAKLWSELQLAKRASKGVKKGSKKASSAKSAVDSKARTTPAKVAGGVVLLGGAGALIARKLKGGDPEPLPYEPPPTPAAPAPSDSADSTPLAAAAPQSDPTEPPVVMERPPIVVGDLAGQDPDADEPAGEEPASDGPGTAELTDAEEPRS